MALPEPITRLEKYWAAILDKIQGGGSSVTVEPLTVTQNGTTTAPSGKAYSPVTTNVPNSYGASDEGKVVSNGALVAQTAHAPVTQNGTIDTTLNNSVPINVPNPNYVETISGTLGNPWGDYSIRYDLAPKILSNEIDLNITFSFNNSVYVAFPNPGSLAAITHICSAYSISATTAKLSLLRYTPGGTLQSAKVIPEIRETDGVWNGSGISLDPTTPCTLTIIHHPLPDSE